MVYTFPTDTRIIMESPKFGKLMPKNQIDRKNFPFFESRISDFFQKAGRVQLPWRRRDVSAYEVWVSEIMLQQTQVFRVIPFYEKFLLRFPTVQSLSVASWEEFLPYYAGLGYYARGRNMLQTAKVIVGEFGGKFPNNVGILRKLPGIGPYTAAAIASFAFGQDVLSWDTNLRRVAGRFFLGTKHITGNEQKLFPLRGNAATGNPFSVRAREFNAALMDFGSAICLAKPKCAACPLVERCKYFKENGRGEMTTRGETSTVRKSSDGRLSFGKYPALVVLHENHRKYFSSLEKTYFPFQIEKAYATRDGIKKWFSSNFGLSVSVRPPSRKIHFRKSRDVFLVTNVQILSGSHSFRFFSRDEAIGIGIPIPAIRKKRK